MQKIWSRSAPLQTTCRRASHIHTSANGLTSHSSTAARRRLHVGNSITALYSSIFAAAALADAQAKDKRRHEWDEKIAAVKEEVNELVDEEKRILEVLSSRTRSRTLNWPIQIRQYSSSSAPPAFDEQPATKNQWPNPSIAERISMDEDIHSRSSISFGRPQSTKTKRPVPSVTQQISSDNNLDAEVQELTDDAELNDDSLVDELGVAGGQYDPLTLKALQKLSTKQLAIRLLLRPVVAHEYLGMKKDYILPDNQLPRIKTSQLLTELRSIRRRMESLSRGSSLDDTEIRSLQGLRMGQKSNRELDEELSRDVILYMKNRMSLPELLLRLSNNLVSSTDPDRPTAFRIMIVAFTKTRQNDIVALLLRTLIPFGFTLTGPLIVSIVSYFRKSKNLKDFDSFLQMLRGHSTYKPNLGGMAPFKLEVVNGVEITVPPLESNNSLIWASFIIAALRFDQPERADAWLQAARVRGFGDTRDTLFSYLKFYSIRRDWQEGLNVLKRALAYIASTTLHEEEVIERLIALMVSLCDNCEQYEFSEALIDAAIGSGFDHGFAEKQLDLNFPFDNAYERWAKAVETFTPVNRDRDTLEKCHSFTGIMRKQLHLLISKKNRYSWRKDMNGHYSEASLSVALSGFDKNCALESKVDATELLPQNPGTYSSENTPLGAQNDDLTALRAEVAQLRRLVLELAGTKPQDTAAVTATENVKSPATSVKETESLQNTTTLKRGRSASKFAQGEAHATAEKRTPQEDGLGYSIQDNVAPPTRSKSILLKKTTAPFNRKMPIENSSRYNPVKYIEFKPKRRVTVKYVRSDPTVRPDGSSRDQEASP